MTLLQTSATVFRNPRAILLAAMVSALVFLLATWLPNFRLIADVFGSSQIALSEKIGLLGSLTGSIATNFSSFSASYTIILSILFGIYITLLSHLLKNRNKNIRKKGVASGVLGMGAGALGVGCAACGSFLIPGVLTFVGAGSAIALLPLGGGEFGIIGVLLLVLAITSVARQIGNPATCRISR